MPTAGNEANLIQAHRSPTQAYPVFVRFALTVIHGSKRAVKNGEGLVSSIMWMMSG